VYVDCSDAMDIMSVPWNVVLTCTINDEVQRSKLCSKFFSQNSKAFQNILAHEGKETALP
jgi:hypothetical protein